jgi:hypothetical protein
VNRSIAETQEVRQAVESVERRLQAMQQGLEEIARRTRDPQIKSEIEALSGQVQRSQEVTRTPDRSLQSSVATRRQLIEQIQQVRPMPAGTWAVVIGGDRTLAEARSPDIRAEIRDSAYLVNLDVCCPTPMATEANVYECPNA